MEPPGHLQNIAADPEIIEVQLNAQEDRQDFRTN